MDEYTESSLKEKIQAWSQIDKHCANAEIVAKQRKFCISSQSRWAKAATNGNHVESDSLPGNRSTKTYLRRPTHHTAPSTLHDYPSATPNSRIQRPTSSSRADLRSQPKQDMMSEVANASIVASGSSKHINPNLLLQSIMMFDAGKT